MTMNGMVNLLSRHTIRSQIMVLSGAILLAACSTPVPKQSPGHIQVDEAAPRGKIPEPLQLAIPLPKPRPSAKPETYSVVVSNIRVQDLLFSLARDAKINVDVHPGIAGTVTMNAIDQTLQQLLVRIAKQVDMRFEIENGTLTVMPDSPFLRTYRVDYLDMSRESSSNVSISTQIQSTGGAAGSAGGNSSTTKVTNSTKNDFWKTLEKNIKDILAETDKEIVVARRGASRQEAASRASDGSTTATGSGAASFAAGGTSGGAKQSGGGGISAGGAGNQQSQATASDAQQKSVEEDSKSYQTLFAATTILNSETGVLTVRATARQHEKVQEFLDRVMAGARRQVLIEVTVAEVQLNQSYQQGIDWKRLSNTTGGTGNGPSISQTPFGNPAPTGTPSAGLFLLNYLNPTSRLGNISVTLQLLESFGNVKVLSSPKISVINNQTALLKVVDNKVYFTIKADVVQNQLTTVTTYTTTLNSVPVGFVMQVTPQISEDDTILLNVRPTVSRITGYVNDPNPALKLADVTSRVPEIQSREMDSVLRIPSGQIAVMGGLMQDSINNSLDTIPGAASVPLFGNLFQNRNEVSTKTELVIFLRPQVIRDASIDGDFRSMKEQLPDRDFLKKQIGPRSLSQTSGAEGN
jgi:general secretion pathway protein D